MPWIPKGYAVVRQNGKGAEIRLVGMVRTQADADAKIADDRIGWTMDFGPGFPRYAVLEFRRVKQVAPEG